MSNGYIVNTMGDGTNVDFLLDQQNSQLIEDNTRLSQYIAEVEVEIKKLVKDWRENIEAKRKLEKQYAQLKKLFITKIEENKSLQSNVNMLEHINKRLEEACAKANAKLKSLNHVPGRAKGNG